MGAVRVPQATYVCRNAARIGDNSWGEGAPPSGWCTTSAEFELRHIRNHGLGYATLQIEPVFLVNDVLAVYTHVAVATGYRNIGFDPRRSRADEHTLSTYASVPIGAGVEARVNGFFVSLGADWVASMEPAIGDQIVFRLTMGPRIGGRRERHEPDAYSLVGD